MKLDDIIQKIREKLFDDDVIYVQNNLFKALKIPKELLKHNPYP
jgi:hypothetical protein